MGPTDLDHLEQLIKMFAKDLSKAKAPGNIKAKASDILTSITWMRKARGYDRAA